MVFRTSIEFTSGGETFHCVGNRVTSKGFTSIMPWLAVSENNIPAYKKGDAVSIHKVDIYEVWLVNLFTSHELTFFFFGSENVHNYHSSLRVAPHLLTTLVRVN